MWSADKIFFFNYHLMTTVTEKNSATSSISPTVSEEMVQNMKDAIERQLRLTLARHSENATKEKCGWLPV